MTRLKFILVDSDHVRAAKITAALARHGHRVTVAHSFAEFAAPSRGACVVLVADEAGAIPRVIDSIKQQQIRAKVIAYSADPSPHQMVKAMAAGAADYLHWPFDVANLVAAADAVTAS